MTASIVLLNHFWSRYLLLDLLLLVQPAALRPFGQPYVAIQCLGPAFAFRIAGAIRARLGALQKVSAGLQASGNKRETSWRPMSRLHRAIINFTLTTCSRHGIAGASKDASRPPDVGLSGRMRQICLLMYCHDASSNRIFPNYLHAGSVRKAFRILIIETSPTTRAVT